MEYIVLGWSQSSPSPHVVIGQSLAQSDASCHGQETAGPRSSTINPDIISDSICTVGGVIHLTPGIIYPLLNCTLCTYAVNRAKVSSGRSVKI